MTNRGAGKKTDGTAKRVLSASVWRREIQAKLYAAVLQERKSEGMRSWPRGLWACRVSFKFSLADFKLRLNRFWFPETLLLSYLC